MEIIIEGNDNEKIISMHSLFKATCDELETTAADMKSQRRHSDISYKRQVFYYIAQKYSLASLPKIGKFMGRDHTSIMHGIRKIKKVFEGKDMFETQVKNIVKKAEILDEIRCGEISSEAARREKEKIDEFARIMAEKKRKQEQLNKVVRESKGEYRIAMVNGQPLCVPKAAKIG